MYPIPQLATQTPDLTKFEPEQVVQVFASRQIKQSLGHLYETHLVPLR